MGPDSQKRPNNIIWCLEQYSFLNCLEGVVGFGEGVVYLTSPERPTDIGLQLGKACYPCSR